MKKLNINGYQEFLGINIPIISGCFDKNDRIIITKTISEIHKIQLKEVTKSIIRLIESNKLIENIDYVDLKKYGDEIFIQNLFGTKSEYLSRTKHNFALSFSGYKILINSCMFDTGVAGEFIKWYFNCDDFVIIKDYKRQETNFIEFLQQALKPFDLSCQCQYKVLNYRIDAYIPELNLAIEYDENGHKNYSYNNHDGRQKRIENELNCKFIRVTDKNTYGYNVGQVLKEVFVKMQSKSA